MPCRGLAVIGQERAGAFRPRRRRAPADLAAAHTIEPPVVAKRRAGLVAQHMGRIAFYGLQEQLHRAVVERRPDPDGLGLCLDLLLWLDAPQGFDRFADRLQEDLVAGIGAVCRRYGEEAQTIEIGDQVIEEASGRIRPVMVEEPGHDEQRALFRRQAHLLGLLGERRRQLELAERYRAHFAAELAEKPDYAYPRSHLGIALAFLGQQQAALEEGHRAVEIAAKLGRFSSPRQKEFLAIIHVILGEHDQALELLEQLLLRTEYQYALTRAQLRLDPLWDPLRGDPRFERLLGR